MKQFLRSRWILVLAAVSVVGCGVPITAAEIAATAEGERTQVEQERTSGRSITSSQASDAGLDADAKLEETSATPQATVAVLGASESTPTPTPESTPQPTQIATASPIPQEETPTPVPPSSTPSSTPTVPPAPADGFPERVVALLNQVRAERGLSTLRTEPNLAKAAQSYAQHMAENNYFGHTGLDGSTPKSRMIAAGYFTICWGEAISAGQTTPQAALNSLLKSPPHFAILMDPKVVEIGVGHSFNGDAYYGHYWVLATGGWDPPC